MESFEKGLYTNKDTILPQEIKEMIEKIESNDRGTKKTRIQDIKHTTLQENLQYLKDEQRDNDFELIRIPALITKVWGAISMKEFENLKKNPSWMELTTKVCDKCYCMCTKVAIETISMINFKTQVQKKINRV